MDLTKIYKFLADLSTKIDYQDFCQDRKDFQVTCISSRPYQDYNGAVLMNPKVTQVASWKCCTRNLPKWSTTHEVKFSVLCKSLTINACIIREIYAPCDYAKECAFYKLRIESISAPKQLRGLHTCIHTTYKYLWHAYMDFWKIK